MKTIQSSDNKQSNNNSQGEPSNKTYETRLREFQNLKINHPILNESFEELWEAVKSYNDGSLILLFGPTGVGKTTIMGLLEKRLLEELKDELLADREMIPLVKAEIMGSSTSKFDWKDFYREILIELSEFSIDNRVDFTKWETRHQPWLPFDNDNYSYKNIANDNRSTESRLRKSVEQALRHRRPKVVLLDEAQHLTALSTGRNLLDQQNVIKSLANRTETTHALFGSYELMSFCDLNGQIARRTVNVHFRRYVNTSKKDMTDFENIIWNFQQQLPLEEETDLISHTRYLYEGCFGCIGILKDWLYRSLVKLFSGQGKILTLQHLERTKLDAIKLVKIAQECIDGERRSEQESAEAVVKLRAYLGYAQGKDNSINVVKNKTIRNKNGVGNRRPYRDKVGVSMVA